MKDKRDVLNHYTVFMLKVIRAVMKILPYWFMNGVISLSCSVIYTFLGSLKKICSKNLQRLFPDDTEVHVKRVLVQLGHLFTDVLYYVDRPQKLQQKVRMYNEDNLKEALKLGRGVICPSAHLGNFPMMFVAMSQMGYKVNVIIRPMRNPKFGKFVHQLCSEWGVNMIETLPRKAMLKETFRCLKDNELLFILLDEVADADKGAEVEFFGEQVTRAKGPLLYYKKFGSPILPIFVFEDENDHYNIYIENEINVPEDGLDDEKEHSVLSEFTRKLEGWVKGYPYQWGGWLNKKW